MPQTILCPACQSPKTARNGRHTATRTQKAICRDCGRHFRARYRRQAYRPGTDRRIDRLADAGHSIRHIARQLNLSPTTVWTRRKALKAAYREQIAKRYPIPKDVFHVVSWSGGKDSFALVVWTLEHLPQADTLYVFCDTGWESPLTYQFLDGVNQRLLGDRLIVLRSRRYAGLLDLAR